MSKLQGTLKPLVSLTNPSSLYQTVTYPVGGTNGIPTKMAECIATTSDTSPLLTVSFMSSGFIIPGMIVTGPGIPANTVVLNQTQPTGPTGLTGAGTYNLSKAAIATYVSATYTFTTTGPPIPNGPLNGGLPINGPVPGYNCVNIMDIRNYYNLPYPPSTPLASPPVIAVVSFGGGIYGQQVTSGKYAGFWKCTDISGQGGAPIQILVAPINGAINAPNSDDGGSTLENTIDVATISAFYGMSNPTTPITYTPPIIILYIAPSSDLSEMYRTFYTVLNNPVVCNGQSYSPSVVCCSWGAPETAWTQVMAFPPNVSTPVDTTPSPAGIAELNRINDLLSEATQNGINICVASGDIPLDRNSASLNAYNYAQLLLRNTTGAINSTYQPTLFPLTPEEIASLPTPTVMFPASSPYVTCVGGSSVYFPNISTGSYSNPMEFAWARGEGGVSSAFPIPNYQQDLPTASLVSSTNFLSSSLNTSALASTALGMPSASDPSASNTNITLARINNNAAYTNAAAALASAQAALTAAQANSANDTLVTSLVTTVKDASIALANATVNNKLAMTALSNAEDAVVKIQSLEASLSTATNIFGAAEIISGDGPNSQLSLAATANAAAIALAAAQYANLLDASQENQTALTAAQITNADAQAASLAAINAAKTLPGAIVQSLDVANNSLVQRANSVIAPAFIDNPVLDLHALTPDNLYTIQTDISAALADINVSDSELIQVYGRNYSIDVGGSGILNDHKSRLETVVSDANSIAITTPSIGNDIGSSETYSFDALLITAVKNSSIPYIGSSAVDGVLASSDASGIIPLADFTGSSQVPQIDASGDPVLDASGDPIYDTVTSTISPLQDMFDLVANTTAAVNQATAASDSANASASAYIAWAAAKEKADAANAAAQTLYQMVPAPSNTAVAAAATAALNANNALSAATVKLANTQFNSVITAVNAKNYINDADTILNVSEASNNVITDGSGSLNLLIAQQFLNAANSSNTISSSVLINTYNTISGINASGTTITNLIGLEQVVNDSMTVAAAIAPEIAEVALADSYESLNRYTDWVMAAAVANAAALASATVSALVGSGTDILSETANALSKTTDTLSKLTAATTPTQQQATPQAILNTNNVVVATANLATAQAAATAANNAMQLASSTLLLPSYNLNLAYAKVAATSAAAACAAAAISANEAAYQTALRAQNSVNALSLLASSSSQYSTLYGTNLMPFVNLNLVAGFTSPIAVNSDGDASGTYGNLATIVSDAVTLAQSTFSEFPPTNYVNALAPFDTSGTNINGLYNAMKNANSAIIYAAGNTFTNFSPSILNLVNTAAANAANALQVTLYAEGSVLYTVSQRDNALAQDYTNAINYAAAFNSYQSYIDIGNTLRLSSLEVYNDSVAALHAADLANAYAPLAAIAMTSASQVGVVTPIAPYNGIVYPTAFPLPSPSSGLYQRGAAPFAPVSSVVAQNLAFQQLSTAKGAVAALNLLLTTTTKLETEYTNAANNAPSLVDAATSAINLTLTAANLAKNATNVLNPYSFVSFISETQDDILIARAQAQANVEAVSNSDYRYLSRVNMLNLWNDAVIASGNAVAALADAPTTGVYPIPSQTLLNDLIDNLINTVGIAYFYTAGSSYIDAYATTITYDASSNFFLNNGVRQQNYPEDSVTVAYSTAVEAYNDVQGITNQILFLLNRANIAIVAALNAANNVNLGSPDISFTLYDGWFNASSSIGSLLQSIIGNGYIYDSAVVVSGTGGAAITQGTLVDTLVDQIAGTDAFIQSNPATSLLNDSQILLYGVAGLSAYVYDTNKNSLQYTTAFTAWNQVYEAYQEIQNSPQTTYWPNAESANVAKIASKNAIAAAITSAKRASAAAELSSNSTNALATSTSAYQDIAAAAASAAMYSATANVNMYRCIPDIAMHANADDLPIIYRLNGSTVYAAGTSAAAAMFAGFLGMVQSHSPVNFFVNPILYNNYIYPSAFLNDISGSSEVFYAGNTNVNMRSLPNRLTSIVLSALSGSYNKSVGLGSIRGMALSSFLQAPELVTNVYPVGTTVTVYPGTTATITAYVEPLSAYNTNVTFTSSSPYNVTVTETQTVTQGTTPVAFNPNGSPCMIYTATITGGVPVAVGAPLPTITIASTDGSNVFGTYSVVVLPAKQVSGVSITAEGETINPSNTTLFLGTNLQLVATVTPSNATNQAVFWWSSNPNVVNVDVSGLITSLAPGSSTIKATSVNNNISASINVYVPTPITGLSILPLTLTINPNMLVYPLNNTALIRAVITPANADYKHLTWTVTSQTQKSPSPMGITDVISLPVNGTVLTTNSAGEITDNTQATVTALSNGTAVITVSTYGVPYGVYGTYSASVTVNVVTPITGVRMLQNEMVIMLNPESMVNPTLPETYTVTATLLPAHPSNMSVFWSSSNPKVAVVSNNTPAVLNTTVGDPNIGLWQITETITALSNGNTVIQITTADGNRTAMTSVVVTTPVTGLTMSAMPVSLSPGRTYALQATILPSTATNLAVTWASTNTSIATVNNQGVVTAVTTGSCAISATTQDGGFSALTTINVYTPLVGVQLMVNTPTPIYVGSTVQILVVMVPITASNQQFTWSITNGPNGSIFTNGPPQNGNIVYLDAVMSGTSLFTVTTADGNKQASINLTVIGNN